MKRVIVCGLLILSLLSCSGCFSSIYGNFRELESLELIRTICFDSDESGVKVTTGTDTISEKSKPKIYSCSAPTVFAAIELLEKMNTGKQPFYSHTEHVMIGEEAAKKGIAAYLDFAVRSTELRLDTNLFIVSGGEAGAALGDVLTESSTAADTLLVIEKQAPRISTGFVYTFGEVCASLARNGYALIQAVQTIKSSDITKDNKGKMLVPAGFAVIKEDKLVGFTDGDTTTGMCILLGKAEGGTLCLEREGIEFSLRIVQIKAKFQPKFEGTKLVSMDIKVSAELNVEEVDGDFSLSSEDSRKKLDKSVAELVIRDIEIAVQTSKDLGLDLCGLGGKVEAAAPVKYRKMDPSWKEAFPPLPISATVDIELSRTYDIDMPLKISGEDQNAH